MRSGKIPCASAGIENGMFAILGLYNPERGPQHHTDTLFYRLSDGMLDGKSAPDYGYDLSRGDLSRPACSHVK
jgi:hypothetical protein